MNHNKSKPMKFQSKLYLIEPGFRAEPIKSIGGTMTPEEIKSMALYMNRISRRNVVRNEYNK